MLIAKQQLSTSNWEQNPVRNDSSETLGIIQVSNSTHITGPPHELNVK